ncbi:conserved hypothetical protein [uncultured Desulfatiglans sp.]|nr:conserved hypothetical protein [uncultured Desulfatiglans sp.]
MRVSEAQIGRIFVIRLEDGEILHEAVEAFADRKDIRAAALIALGGADKGSRLVVGPADGRAQPPVVPLEHILGDVHEISGTGTLFPDESGKPILHMHIASGRRDRTVTGCVRNGVKVWQVMEVILFELLGTSAARIMDDETGFKLLRP